MNLMKKVLFWYREWSQKMPTKLELPQINDVALLPTFVLERQNGNNALYFTNYQLDWNNRYNEYITNQGNPENINISTVSQDDKGKFINLYLSKPNSIKSEIDEPLNNHNLSFCPFCSEAGRPNTLDHFLPKDSYPEFSILSKNLVPACDYCQKRNVKGTKVFNHNNKRLFLHPYYDIPENIQLIKIKIKPPYSIGHNYKLYVNENIRDLNLKKLTRRHIKTLHIDSRFRDYYSKEYLRVKELIRDSINVFESINQQQLNIQNVKDLVNTFYQKNRKISINYWDALIFKAFLDNDDILEFILENR